MTNLKSDNQVDQLADFINSAKDILVFSGAGISTESGISDYRSKGGIWDRFQPVTIQEFVVSEEKRIEYWRRKLELYGSMKDAQPNAGHKAIRDIEKLGKLKGIVTQNIDGLHHMAGNSAEKILEIHGSNRQTVCLSCGDLHPWQEVYKRLESGEKAPLCNVCLGLLKPNTISFGQELNPRVLEDSLVWAKSCDLLLAIGSTLIVEPAASIPRIAKSNGAKLVIITLSQTPLDDCVDLKITDSAGKILSQAIEGLEKKECQVKNIREKENS